MDLSMKFFTMRNLMTVFTCCLILLNSLISVGAIIEDDIEDNTTLPVLNQSGESVLAELSSSTTPTTTTETTTTTTTVATPKSSVKFFQKSSPKKRRVEIDSIPIGQDADDWKCPNITSSRSLECGCDLPHTLRCNGDLHGLSVLSESLRASPYPISLLDCSLRNVSFLSDAKIFENISLHGLVISSGEIKRVHKSAFLGLKTPLQALGLPSNALLSVPWNSITHLTSLERLDLSNNKIKTLGTADFSSLQNLIYLELSNNQISSISVRSFTNAKRLEVLKLGGNRLGDFPSSLRSLSQCYNLRQLDLSSNSINGPLSASTIPALRNLELLNLDKNLIKSIQNKALQNFTRLTSLSLQHNQIDVLQDHAFYGLGSLEILDLSYNGIVAISSSSLQHLARLKILDITHNFLRALTSDLIAPLPSLNELRLSGNDISIVAKNAFDGAKELKSLSLQENPLSCDCTIRPFAEWLQIAKLPSQDLISPTCVTPPRLEGAPLIQVPVESLHCDMDNIEKDNANILEQLEAISRQNNSTNIRDLSEKISLLELHYSTDYGLILQWILNLSQDDYMCDAIFVYKEENINEILIDKSPIHCESKIINGQNTVSVIVPESSILEIGESYRFCLVLVQEDNPKSEVVIGCSNITKLQLSNPNSNFDNRPQASLNRRPMYPSDISNIDRISTHSDEISGNEEQIPYVGGRKYSMSEYPIGGQVRAYNFIDSLNKSFLPGLGLGILVTSIFVLIWGATRIRSNSRPNTPTATTCYAASERIAHLADPEHGARYLKLQATTSL
ncbi:toll-like receptor 3 [Eupeodes corollae]|uniref:toll-like receptor 3 n=1 Tax=Eupeodes corollae TaxID=290404 RepID=UPI0024912431|nr:toll-like receptor 3 [Eupeodes corollae]XP_055916464.1 toll-like receptor 3 [Eupeodes corollae]